ncbi:hypothetical protein F8388_019302 [Cannabis sativa]|uniref:RNase H type-1 domain-containing protein n=1 Tax=Cannabis sativa TaxID=3483 RepID=A0A7J6FTF5_CANSA|nr:hypothetical protein F8388_019302 [Cannabis sativa]KAF4388346.1 hypothetical protein G4B88_013183 [Cannabis sativa]
MWCVIFSSNWLQHVRFYKKELGERSGLRFSLAMILPSLLTLIDPSSIKICVDGSFKHGYSALAVVCYILDGDPRVVTKVCRASSALKMEARAIFSACKFALEQEWEEITICSDCKPLFIARSLNGQADAIAVWTRMSKCSRVFNFGELPPVVVV